MTSDDTLQRFGLPASPHHRGEIRQLLSEEIERERRGESGEEMLRTLCVQLFSLGVADDALLIWDAKQSSFDAGCGLDVQFLCGAGLAETKAYLAKSSNPSASAALEYLTECEQAGEFADWTPQASIDQYRSYYGLCHPDCLTISIESKPKTESNVMTPENSPGSDHRRAKIGWWSAWLLIFALAAPIPYLHWTYDVAGIVEPLRHPWGLLPAHWLFFRESGEIATYAFVFVCFCGVWALRQPEHRRAIIMLAGVAALVSSVASAMLTSTLMIAFIREEAQRTPEERLRLNMGLGPAPKNSKPDAKQ